MPRTILTVGTFDLTHFGHYKLFERCKKLVGEDGEVVVGLNTDDFIAKYKGKHPVLTYNERLKNIMSCKWVDDVIMNYGKEDLSPLLADVEPNILAVGSDWAKKDYYTQIGVSKEELDMLDILLVYLPYTDEISSTEIKKRLND